MAKELEINKESSLQKLATSAVDRENIRGVNLFSNCKDCGGTCICWIVICLRRIVMRSLTKLMEFSCLLIIHIHHRIILHKLDLRL